MSPTIWPVELIPGVNANLLLTAIAQVETDGGRNNWPNLEESWIPAGETFTVEGRILKGTGRNVSGNPIVLERWKKYGLPTAASWGPYQILYHTAADRGFAGLPWDLFSFSVSEPYVRAQLLKIAARGPTSVGDFGDAWNSGNFRDANRVPEYRAKLEKAYERLTPAPPAQ